MTQELTYADVTNGRGLVATVMDVLHGGGTDEERTFVWFHVSREIVLAIAIANSIRKVTIE